MQALIFTVLVSATAGTTPRAPDKNSVEIVRPESYSIRRFQEVVQNSKASEDHTPQEELIAMRAKLVIAEQRLRDLKARHAQQQLNPPTNESALVKEVHLRSAQAQYDHYAKMVERNEEKILKDTRAQRSDSKTFLKSTSVPKSKKH